MTVPQSWTMKYARGATVHVSDGQATSADFPKVRMNNHFSTLGLLARRHLSRSDPILREVIRQIGPFTLQHNPDGFAVLVHSIISQQISTKAAAAIRIGRRQKLARQRSLRRGNANLEAVGRGRQPEPDAG